MARGISISLLMVMGLIANQLPILWMSYQTYNQRYATFYCVNPGTSCHGSCTMQREFLERSTAADQTGTIPMSVLSEARDLSPATLLTPAVTPTTDEYGRSPSHYDADAVIVRSQRPPTPPPRA